MAATAAKKPATRRKELAEMAGLLAELREAVNSSNLGRALAKRSYLKRGREAIEKHGLVEDCPPADRPYAEFFDTIHTLTLQERMRMAGVGTHRTSGDFRGLEQELPRLWPAVYGKQADDPATAGIVIRIERPELRRQPDDGH